MTSASDRLVGKACDYEVLAASRAERGALVVGGGDHVAAAVPFSVAALILREVAAALDEDRKAA